MSSLMRGFHFFVFFFCVCVYVFLLLSLSFSGFSVLSTSRKNKWRLFFVGGKGERIKGETFERVSGARFSPVCGSSLTPPWICSVWVGVFEVPPHGAARAIRSAQLTSAQLRGSTAPRCRRTLCRM